MSLCKQAYCAGGSKQVEGPWLWLLALVTCDRGQVTSDMLQVTGDKQHMTHDRWHMKRDTWHVTPDAWHMIKKSIVSVLLTRPCLYELQEDNCVKIKLISLD